MRGMILAAGRGTRMGALTASTPKSLLRVKERYLIEYSLFALKNHGIQDVIINVSYHSEQIKAILGDGSKFNVRIHYSEEKEPLETGGGIYQALPLLGREPFIVLSSDIITDYPLARLPTEPKGLAHLVLVDNPSYHPTGDFCLLGDQIELGEKATFTFGNIGVYRPELFAHCKLEKFGLRSLLMEAIRQKKISGEHYQGLWYNLGTAEDLAKLNNFPSLPSTS